MFLFTWFDFESSNTESELGDFAVYLQEKSIDLESNSEEYPIKVWICLLFLSQRKNAIYQTHAT